MRARYRSALLVGLALAVSLVGGAVPLGNRAAAGTAYSAGRPDTRVVLSADPRFASSKIRSAAVAALRRDLVDLSSLYSVAYVGPTHLVLADTVSDFVDLAGSPPEDVLAVADDARRTIVVSPTSWRGDPGRLDSVLRHEAGHLVLGAKFAGARQPLPRWLDEGLAMYVSSDWDFDLSWAEQQKETMDLAVASGRLVGLREVERLFAGDRSQVRIAYAESYSFVAYIAAAYGEDALERFVDKAAAPSSTLDDASQRAFGVDLGRVESAWLKSLRQETSWWAVLLDRTNFFVILWSLIAATAVVGFIVRTYRKRKAYAELDAGEETLYRPEEPRVDETGYREDADDHLSQ